MRKAALALALTLATLWTPAAAAEEACVHGQVGACLAVGVDDGVYVCEHASGYPGCAVYAAGGREREVEAYEPVEGNHAIVDAEGEDVELSYARTRSEIGNELLVARGGASGAYAQHREQWVNVNASGEGSSRLCFVADVDGTLVGVACGDWVNGEIAPVFVDNTGATVNEIRNDPTVRCVTTRQCPI